MDYIWGKNRQQILYNAASHTLIPSKARHFLTSWLKIYQSKRDTLFHAVIRTLRYTALGIPPEKKKRSVFYYSIDGHAKNPWCEVSSRFILLQLQHTKPVTTLQYSFIKQEIVHHYLTVSKTSFFLHYQTILFHNGSYTDVTRKFNSVCITNPRTVFNVPRLQAWMPTDPVKLRFFNHHIVRLLTVLFPTLPACVNLSHGFIK